jgi:hypothetical protein
MPVPADFNCSPLLEFYPHRVQFRYAACFPEDNSRKIHILDILIRRSLKGRNNRQENYAGCLWAEKKSANVLDSNTVLVLGTATKATGAQRRQAGSVRVRRAGRSGADLHGGRAEAF